GGFIKSCAYPGAKLSDRYLSAYCLNTNHVVFGYNYSVIDLGRCVGNNGGTLVGYPNGNYSNSCDNCSTRHASSLRLECDCMTTVRTTQRSSVDLDDFISNNDGAMECYGYTGNKTWIPS
ncbi:Cyanovirin-N, partial [Thozetella sp. PMI_491]